MGVFAKRVGCTLLVLGLFACDVADEAASGAPLPREQLGGAPSDNANGSTGAPGAPNAPSAPNTENPTPNTPGAVSPDGGTPTVPTADAATPSAPTLPRATQAVIDAALAAPLSSYHRNANTGDIWCLPCDGAPVVLAATAFGGDSTVDARLLQQIREAIKSGNDPFATGGYAANDERNVTAMFALAKRTPRVWSKLTATEVKKIDLVMTATLVADVYLTADATNAGGVPAGFDGSTNHNRDWNPNYREGMIGAVIVGTEYFGGEAATKALLAAYDHAAFVTELETNGLTNAVWTFGTYQRTPGAGAPSPATVKQGITNYAMHGKTLGQLLDLYVDLANDTFSAKVACGLNAGAGVDVGGGILAGRIAQNCATLPNLGVTGMQKEFDSVDAEGKRSSAGYVRLGVRANLFNQLVLVAYGDWRVTAASTAALARVKVGVTDFFFKARNGYRGYSHAQDEGLFGCTDMDCNGNEAIWTQILAPAHGL